MLANPAIRDVVLVNYWQTYSADPAAVIASLDRTLAALRRGGKEVTIIAGIPAPGFDLPWAMALSNQFGMRLPDAADDFTPSPAMRDAARSNDATLIDLSSTLCPRRPCPLLLGDRLIFSDSNHLSREAVVKLVAPVLESSGVIDVAAR